MRLYEWNPDQWRPDPNSKSNYCYMVICIVESAGSLSKFTVAERKYTRPEARSVVKLEYNEEAHVGFPKAITLYSSKSQLFSITDIN
jgi:hypothetical protein